MTVVISGVHLMKWIGIAHDFDLKIYWISVVSALLGMPIIYYLFKAGTQYELLGVPIMIAIALLLFLIENRWKVLSKSSE